MCNSNKKKKNCNENAKTIYLDTKLCGKEPPTTANVVHSSEMEGLCLKWNDCGQMLQNFL